MENLNVSKEKLILPEKNISSDFLVFKFLNLQEEFIISYFTANVGG